MLWRAAFTFGAGVALLFFVVDVGGCLVPAVGFFFVHGVIDGLGRRKMAGLIRSASGAMAAEGAGGGGGAVAFGLSGVRLSALADDAFFAADRAVGILL